MPPQAPPHGSDQTMQEYSSRRNRQVCMVVWIAVDILDGRKIPAVELAHGHDRRGRGCHCLRRGLSAEHHAAPFDTMATGPEGGGYYEIGKQYQELLARTGVELRLVETAGSVENLALLRDPHSGVNIALVQGGSVGQAVGELESLGTLFYEPLWIFHRGGLEGETLALLWQISGVTGDFGFPNQVCSDS